LDSFSGKGKWIGGGENVPGFPQPKSHGSNHTIESSGFGADIVSAVTGLDVLIVRAAVQHNVALQIAVSRVRVVRDLIRIQDVRAIVNLHSAPQVVDRTILLLFPRPDRNLFFRVAGRGWRHGRGIRGRRDRRGGRGQRLAGYYSRGGGQMTDQSGRG